VVGHAETQHLLRRLQTLVACLPSGRVTLEGGVSEQEKLRLYANCRGVLFVPYDEDYGYVTLEAMLSGKPVITCTDSGAVLEFAKDGETALVCEPEPKSLAHAIDRLWSDRAVARRMGEAGRARYESMKIGWPHVVDTLLS
jgi:glycosyltransferase involved in cell wall biosynthesis